MSPRDVAMAALTTAILRAQAAGITVDTVRSLLIGYGEGGRHVRNQHGAEFWVFNIGEQTVELCDASGAIVEVPHLTYQRHFTALTK